jgi:hypothetical protein
MILPMVIGALQGLFDDWAGESFGWSMLMSSVGVAFGGPGACLGWIVSSIQVRGAAPGEPDDGGQLAAGWNGPAGSRSRGGRGVGAAAGDTGWRRRPHAVAHTIWDWVPSFLQPWLVRHAHNRTGSSPGKELVHVAGRAG